MNDNKNAHTGYIKKDTLLIAIAIALVAGFLAGIAFTKYKPGTNSSSQNSVMSQMQANEKTGTDSNKIATEITELEKRTTDRPDDAEAWTRLGNLYFDSNKHDKAITAYNRSLKLKPDDADVLTDLGVMYQRSGQPSEAIKSFDKAIEVDPRHESSLFNKGIVLLHDLNDRQGALKTWEDLVKLNPSAKTSGGKLVSDMIQQLKIGETKH
jgi:cytochrome c-type biogenesis protein CcmH/NrfG